MTEISSDIPVEEEPKKVDDPGHAADEIAGVQRAAALEENLGQVADKTQSDQEDVITIVRRIESKLDQLLGRP